MGRDLGMYHAKMFRKDDRAGILRLPTNGGYMEHENLPMHAAIELECDFISPPWDSEEDMLNGLETNVCNNPNLQKLIIVRPDGSEFLFWEDGKRVGR